MVTTINVLLLVAIAGPVIAWVALRFNARLLPSELVSLDTEIENEDEFLSLLEETDLESVKCSDLTAAEKRLLEIHGEYRDLSLPFTERKLSQETQALHEKRKAHERKSEATSADLAAIESRSKEQSVRLSSLDQETARLRTELAHVRSKTLPKPKRKHPLRVGYLQARGIKL